MSNKVRVHELSKELRVPSKEVLRYLSGRNIFVRSASSFVDGDVAAMLRRNLGPGPKAQSVIGNQEAAVASTENGIPASSQSSSLRQYGWRAGAVAEPSNGPVLERLKGASRRFPIIEEHREAFKALGSQIFYARGCEVGGFKDCFVARVRFSGAIESAFGFTREVVLFYSPHEDLQARTFEAAKQTIRESSVQVTPDTFFMWSPDPKLSSKLKDWSTPNSLAIPLQIDPEDQFSLITLLRDHVYSRDLFYVTTPVRGASFFGRRTLLQTLRDDVVNQRVSGLFGLRKSGKTSILLQLANELGKDDSVVVLLDLETFSSPPDDPIDEIISDLRFKLLLELRSKGLRTKELAELDKQAGIIDFRHAMLETLRRLSKSGVSVLLMLDEIEYLTPSDNFDVREGGLPRIAQFLSMLRGLVQESDNFTFILSGLTSDILDSGRLYGRPNPLFSWAKATYVSPFSRVEADNLAVSVGSKMGIEFNDGALEAIHEASGGHAYLYRNLCSSVVRNLPDNDFYRRVDRSMVLAELDEWRIRVRGNIQEMIDHVRRYYGTEAVLLDFLIDDSEGFKEVGGDEPAAVKRLLDLGLAVKDSDGGVSASVVLELL